ncbi:MSMEG_1061 family FMN-dependent PPOX-type flavoprotein [Metabacillus sp. 84]|uniref:MSMEG_1061 family FMN-dependent PPOX-type flavoprotein n=1 Tax=Metabacillus sp. 84 TaxID=3404705 RepID=UPI003CE95A2B
MLRSFADVIETQEELNEIWGEPSRLVSNKAIDHLDPHCINFLAMTPFILLGTSNAEGECDVSPRGDHPGFILVLNEKQLVIPERPGNKRLDSIRNILDNPKAGLICMIPGMDESLRMTGKASVMKDQDILERMRVNGKLPFAGIVLEVEECFIHCGKAIKRSKLWQTDSWPASVRLPKAHEILAAHANCEGLDADRVEKALDESYRLRMY